MMPVPRKLSASCGTCVDYEASGPLLEQMDTDVERVFAVAGETYTLLLENEWKRSDRGSGHFFSFPALGP